MAKLSDIKQSAFEKAVKVEALLSVYEDTHTENKLLEFEEQERFAAMIYTLHDEATELRKMLLKILEVE